MRESSLHKSSQNLEGLKCEDLKASPLKDSIEYIRLQSVIKLIISIDRSHDVLRSVQRVMAIGLPLGLSMLWAQPALCEAKASQAPPKPQQRPPSTMSVRLSAILEAVVQELQTQFRGLYLGILFSPCLFLAPICVGLGIGWLRWVRLLRWCLERAGPAFIKWGQVTILPNYHPDLKELGSLVQRCWKQFC